MIKKFFSVLLILCVINFGFLPSFAADEKYTSSNIINTEFKTELNLNKASNGQIVQFVSTQNYVTDGISIPQGTIFSGEIKRLKKSRFGYRRAKAVIEINKMTLPGGETVNVKAAAKRHVLKGSAVVNIGKGIITFPVAVVTGFVGGTVILLEAVSIVGIIAIGPTSYLFGETMGKLTHGINYKKHEGDKIKLKIKN